MRIVDPRLALAALALLAVACGPHRHGGPHHGMYGDGHHHNMAEGCGAEGCVYRNRCFSNGAVSSNAGVCQQCSDGRWVSADGCRDGAGSMGEKPCDHHDHHARMGEKPCDHDHHHGRKGKRHHRHSER